MWVYCINNKTRCKLNACKYCWFGTYEKGNRGMQIERKDGFIISW